MLVARAVEEHVSLHPQSEFFRKHFDDGLKEDLPGAATCGTVPRAGISL